MAKYLWDRHRGGLYGWNDAMAKLRFMQEVDIDPSDDNSQYDKPDPTYVDEEGGFPIAETPAQVGGVTPELAADADRVTAEAIAKAAKEGEEALGEPPEFDGEGHLLLGYDADDAPVYETDEERDMRLGGDKDQPAPEPDEPEDDEPVPVEEPKPAARKRK